MSKRQKRRNRYRQKRIDANVMRIGLGIFAASTPFDVSALQQAIAKALPALTESMRQAMDGTYMAALSDRPPSPFPCRSTWAAIASDANPMQDIQDMSDRRLRWFPQIRREPESIEIEAPNPVSIEIHVTSPPTPPTLPPDGAQWEERPKPPSYGEIVEKLAPCAGCRYLVGSFIGGNLLVCAVHPYGVDGECPDYEASEK